MSYTNQFTMMVIGVDFVYRLAAFGMRLKTCGLAGLRFRGSTETAIPHTRPTGTLSTAQWASTNSDSSRC